MKKILALLSLLVIAMFVISCSGQKANSTTGAAVKNIQEKTQKALPEAKEKIESTAKKAVETVTSGKTETKEETKLKEENKAEVSGETGDGSVHNIATVSRCSDNDGGNNVKVKSSVVALGKTYYDYCAPNGLTLFERNCMNDQMVSIGYDCGIAGDGYKCVDGACVNQ